MAKRKKDVITPIEHEVYRRVLTTVEEHLTSCDHLAQSLSDRPLRRLHAIERDAWAIARDALIRPIRKYQEETSGDKEAGL